MDAGKPINARQIREALPEILGIAGEQVDCIQVEITSTEERAFTLEDKYVLRPDSVNPLPVFVNRPRSGPIHGTILALPRASSTYCQALVTDEFRKHTGLWLAERGWVTLVPVVLGHEERQFPPNSVSWHPAWDSGIANLLYHGRTLIGEIVLDVLRVLAYFRTRDLCQSKPMGIIGGEGLNLAAVCAAIIDPSLEFVANFRCLGDYADREREHYFDSWAEFVPNLLAHADLSELTAMLAPRPLFLSRNDDLLSRNLTARLFGKVRMAYEQADAVDMLTEQVVPCGWFCNHDSMQAFWSWLERLPKPGRVRRPGVSLGTRPSPKWIGQLPCTRFDWMRQREQGLEVIRELAGGFPHKSVDPEPQRLGILEHEDFIRETVSFRVSADDRTTADFYLPRTQSQSPLPVILALHNHGGRFYEGRTKSSDERWIRTLVQSGFPVLIQDALGFGDRRLDGSVSQGPSPEWFEIAGMYHSMRGQTIAGVMIRDFMSAIDYLQTRAEVDAARIGVTGYSMGGSDAVWLSVFDQRIKATVSVNGFYLKEVVFKARIPGMGAHSFFPGQLQYFDNDMVAALIAPRPLLLCHSRQDSGTPEQGPRRIGQFCRCVYDLLSEPEKFDILSHEGDHAYLAEFQQAAVAWFRRWL